MLLPTLRGTPSPCMSMHNLVNGKSVKAAYMHPGVRHCLEAIRDWNHCIVCIEIQTSMERWKRALGFLFNFNTETGIRCKERLGNTIWREFGLGNEIENNPPPPPPPWGPFAHNMIALTGMTLLIDVHVEDAWNTFPTFYMKCFHEQWKHLIILVHLVIVSAHV